MSNYDSSFDPCLGIRHRFNSKKAFIAQKELKRRIDIKQLNKHINIVGGIDLSYIQNGTIGIGVLVLLSYPDMTPLRCLYSIQYTCVPYIPGLLAFREMPPIALVLIKAKKLGIFPDLLLVDGHGMAHPRGFGIASHIGVVFNIPTIGVAKRKLTGYEYNDRLLNRKGHIIAYILKRGSKRIYVSIGNKVDLETAKNIVSTIWREGRLPLPLLLADSISKQLKHAILKKRPEIGEVYSCNSYILRIL